MLKKITFWLNCARLYTLPITILSWAVIFVYSIKHGGNVFFGFLALFGISLVHLATNLIDDYIDYPKLNKEQEYINVAKNCKCAYLKNNSATIKDLRNVILIFLTFAAIIGLYLFFVSGHCVILLAIIGLIIALTYPLFSLNGLGEISVITAYGPLMFEGVYYVMCGDFSWEVCILSFACAFMTNTILYAHMLMDFDQDETSHKKTLCRALKTKENALNFILIFYVLSFTMCGYLAISSRNYLYLLPLLTIPQIIDLYHALKMYNNDKNSMPKIRFWHQPLKLTNTEDAPFFFRFLYSRNIMVFYMVLISIAIIFGEY